MARTRNTDGTVRETPKGSGWYRAMLPPRLSPAGQRKYIEGRWRSKTEARRALNKAIADIEDGRRVVPSRKRGEPVRKVRDAVCEYIEYRENSATAPIGIRTARGYKGDLNNHICNPKSSLGITAVERLTPANVRQWMDDLARDGNSPGVIAAAKRLLNAALNWEVAEGRIPRNPSGLVRKESSKFSRAAEQSADEVLLPSWSEFRTLVIDPDREEDRLLIALLGWSGLRWSEAISLESAVIWRDRPQVTISRVLTKRTEKEMEGGKEPWEVEPPEGGLTATIPLPRPLWERLVRLADERLGGAALPEPAGILLFRQANPNFEGTNSIGALDNSNFNDREWTRARTAAGLTGDKSLPPLDPRRNAIKIKDLRAFAASVLLDAGASLTEAALLLRHSNTATTERHYARAMADRAHDAARRAVSIDKSLSIEERLDALWEAWVTAFPDVEDALGIAKREERHLRLIVNPDTDNVDPTPGQAQAEGD